DCGSFRAPSWRHGDRTSPMGWPHRLAPSTGSIDRPHQLAASTGAMVGPLANAVAAPRRAGQKSKPIARVAAGSAGSRLKLGIPVEIVEPALVQVIGGEQSAIAV